MDFQKYTQIFDGESNGSTIRSYGKSFDLNFKLNPKENKRYRLFTVGETEQFYLWKDEPDCPNLYYMLTDALDTKHAIRDRYCLSFSCKKYEDYLKRIYKKVMWKPMLSYLSMNPVPTEWKAGLTVSAKGLSFKKDGFLRMRIDIRLKKENVDPHSVLLPADQSFVIDIPEGTYFGDHLSIPIQIPEDTANVGVFVEGKRFKGECYIEQPHLSASGHNLLPSFNEAVQNRTHMDWAAQYLSRKELPEFRVKLNGNVIYQGEIFERCHRHSEWEICLPSKLLKENNVLSYQLISDYHNPLPYTFYEVGVIEESAAPLSILAVSEVAPAGGKARVLINTQQANLRVKFQSESNLLSANDEWFFKSKGLHGILLDCLDVGADASFQLSWDGGKANGAVKRIAKKSDDGVITGTGDMVYICQNDDSMEEYLSWYISNAIGDFITIRPTYRWSGTKLLNKKVFKKFTKLMNELDMKYVLMADGRELPGISAQPDEQLLKGKGFLGVQQHERDGAQFYWTPKTAQTLFDEQKLDLMHFAYSEDPDHTSSKFSEGNFYYNNGTMNIYADRRRFDDYCDERKKSVDSLRNSKRERDSRHTGPSSVFKYMAEAGYRWLGAETMYQTMEPIMGFIRGVAKEYKMPTFGVHHAVQWSTTPHLSPARYRRYRLALYASYMLGANDINTEEGLWRLEEFYEYHHRFGEACRNHLKQQQDFYKYVSSHTRSGAFYTPVAFVHGRDDGVTFVGKNNSWGHHGEKRTTADDSWDLLKSVYPMAKPRALLYRHPCPERESQGYHTGTPFGNLDVIPAEAKSEIWQEYSAAIFMGYNRFTHEDGEKILQFLHQGGKVLLCDAHLTTTCTYSEIYAGSLSIQKNPLVMSDGEPVFVNDFVENTELLVCENPLPPDRVLAYTDSGRPLICVYHVGKGELVVVHTREYPAHPAISALYEEQIRSICKEMASKENVWAETGNDVEFAVYRQADQSSHIYFLAVDWYGDPNIVRNATLRIGTDRYVLSIPFGVMIKCVCKESVSVFAESEDGEVLSVENGVATVQGEGVVSFRICKNGKQRVETLDFTKSVLQYIKL